MLAPSKGRSEIEAIVYPYLAQTFPELAVCEADTPLLEGGAIDSLGILELMSFLTDRFGVTLDDCDFVPENLETPSHLVQFIERKRS